MCWPPAQLILKKRGRGVSLFGRISRLFNAQTCSTSPPAGFASPPALTSRSVSLSLSFSLVTTTRAKAKHIMYHPDRKQLMYNSEALTRAQTNVHSCAREPPMGLLAEDVAVAVLVPGLHRRRLRLHPLVLVLLGGSVDAGRANLRRAHVEFGILLGEPRGSVLVVDDVLVVVGGEGKRGATVDCG